MANALWRSVASAASFTPGILPSALRASLRLFKIAPGDFVTQLQSAAHGRKYLEISKKLTKALAAYRSEDIERSMKNLDLLHDQLRVGQRSAMDYFFKRNNYGIHPLSLPVWRQQL
jgi:hypothetical protein